MAGPHLSTADLTAHDPRSRPWSPGLRTRHCCPLPGVCEGKKVDAAHRTLTVYPEGGWTCARCKAKGKLTDVWVDRPFTPDPSKTVRTSRDVARSAFSLTPRKRLENLSNPITSEAAAAVDDRKYDVEAELKGLRPIVGTASASYLEGRGIPVAVADRCKVRHSDTFGASCWWERDGIRHVNGKGAPAAVFPMRLDSGHIVGIQGRATEGTFWRGVAKLTFRLDLASSAGAFIPPGALDSGPVVVTEAPIDALSLVSCGVPALATVGTSCPEWLLDALALRRVVLAHDADEAGDKAADAIAAELRRRGAVCERLRPAAAKDWNDELRAKGRDTLAADLRKALRLPDPDPFDGEEEDCSRRPQEGPVSAFGHSEHVKDTEGPANRTPGAKNEAFRFWPTVCSPEYGRLSLFDRLQACAAAGLPSSEQMAHLLASDWSTAQVTGLQSIIEAEAQA